MTVELTPRERDLLVRLVDAAILEIGPEIHHTRTFKDELKEQRLELKLLRTHLLGAAPDPADTSKPPFASCGLLGTP